MSGSIDTCFSFQEHFPIVKWGANGSTVKETRVYLMIKVQGLGYVKHCVLIIVKVGLTLLNEIFIRLEITRKCAL